MNRMLAISLIPTLAIAYVVGCQVDSPQAPTSGDERSAIVSRDQHEIAAKIGAAGGFDGNLVLVVEAPIGPVGDKGMAALHELVSQSKVLSLRDGNYVFRHEVSRELIDATEVTTYSDLGLRLSVNGDDVDLTDRGEFQALSVGGSGVAFKLEGNVDGELTTFAEPSNFRLAERADGVIDIEIRRTGKGHGCCGADDHAIPGAVGADAASKVTHASACMDYNGWPNPNTNCTQAWPAHLYFVGSDCFISMTNPLSPCIGSLIHSSLTYCTGSQNHRCSSSQIFHSSSAHCHC